MTFLCPAGSLNMEKKKKKKKKKEKKGNDFFLFLTWWEKLILRAGYNPVSSMW